MLTKLGYIDMIDINNIVDIVDIKEVNNMFDVNIALEQAILETKYLDEDEVFLVKDLFKGYEWNRIPRTSRLLLGTLFLNHVNSSNNQDIEAIDKTSSNQQKYRKRK